uniref:Isochorismatase-like domain-containing protein n=2 Tax=Chaetoceros debilis TaxID=122233 RepID=A0A7S3Q1A1_9STRA|mmetsp:Transcript_5340/g.7533  ORF Transcript_5340/g.7533 Transcript_5340/m.7533 type:complete len:219 (-) Transcript_5340:102-758(-)
MAAVTKVSRIGKLTPSTTTFFLCDIQERFKPLMYNSETIISTSRYLTSIASTLSIPLIASQQYTKVFGNTIPECFANGQVDVDNLKAKNRIFEKKLFSMMTTEVESELEKEYFQGRDSVVLFGIEAHVCVQQTCLDLLEQGKDVHIIVDCVSSQQPFDREIALTRMESAGAHLTTAQSLAFMLMQSAEHEHFKVISKLTVGHMKLPNQFNSSYEKSNL